MASPVLAQRLAGHSYCSHVGSQFGRGAVVPARAGLVEKRTWSTKFEMLSLPFTTWLSEVPCVSAAQ